MMELLAPAASPEGIRAAVVNGADAVYLGFGTFNARRGAKNFTASEFREAVKYCHNYNVKVYVTVNTLASDREMNEVAQHILEANAGGADAILVQDLGVLRLARDIAPELPLHASTQMTLHNADGAKLAASLGISRIVAARELSLESIKAMCENSPVEIEVFAHGALCFCWSGQCYMSSVLGGRSGNRGMCAQPCRMEYGFSERAGEYPLSLKDLTLVRRLNELDGAGVKCLKIEGRARRPEYAAIVTRVFADALKSKKQPSERDMKILEMVFSRDGFTDGYLSDKLSSDMLGVRGNELNNRDVDALYREARREYENSPPPQRVGVRFMFKAEAGVPSRLAAGDSTGGRVLVDGAVPEPAKTRALSNAEVTTQLYKTGGSPYFCEHAKASVDAGLSLPLSEINAMRRGALAELDKIRLAEHTRPVGNAPLLSTLFRRTDRPQLIVHASRLDQISDRLLRAGPPTVYLPLDAVSNESRLSEVLSASTVALTLPRVAPDREIAEIERKLSRAYDLGVREILIGNAGYIPLAKRYGFAMRGDFGLNVFNSLTLEELKILGFKSATMSFELNFAQIRDIRKPLDTEIIAYGRLPLMLTEQCIVKNKYGKCLCDNDIRLVDRKQAAFPVMRESESSHRNVVLNSQKLWLADRQDECAGLGVGHLRLLFTTENALECAEVFTRYSGQGKYEPQTYTRGLYFRTVE